MQAAARALSAPGPTTRFAIPSLRLAKLSRKTKRHVFPVRVRQHKMVNQMREGLPADGNAQVRFQVREIRGPQSSRLVTTCRRRKLPWPVPDVARQRLSRRCNVRNNSLPYSPGYDVPALTPRACSPAVDPELVPTRLATPAIPLPMGQAFASARCVPPGFRWESFPPGIYAPISDPCPSSSPPFSGTSLFGSAVSVP